jgi:hypothetical protein
MKTIRALEVISVHALHRPHLAHAAALAAAIPWSFVAESRDEDGDRW